MMWGLPPAVQIHLFSQAIDLRKGADGLRALVDNAGLDVFAGHLYVFLARRPNRAKILWWDGGGFVIWYKRLEKGCFLRPAGSATSVVHIEAIQLSMLLEGIDVTSVRRPSKWVPQRIKTRVRDRQVIANMI